MCTSSCIKNRGKNDQNGLNDQYGLNDQNGFGEGVSSVEL